MNKPRILIIDDEAQMRKLLEITLTSNDYQVLMAANAKEGIAMAASHQPELILLDIGLPDEDGHSVLKQLRAWYTAPILIVSVLNNEEDIVAALDNGANDYLVKPFRTGELLARIRSALRAAITDPMEPVKTYKALSLDLNTRTLKVNGDTIKLTSTEYALISLLVRNEGKVLTHHYLLKEIWGPGYLSQSQYLRVFIAQLRKKIEPDPNRPTYILTESGIGYRFMGTD